MTQQAALWADEVEAKEVPKKEGREATHNSWGCEIWGSKTAGVFKVDFFFGGVGDYAKKASERTKFSWRFWNGNFNHFDVRRRNATQKNEGNVSQLRALMLQSIHF